MKEISVIVQLMQSSGQYKSHHGVQKCPFKTFEPPLRNINPDVWEKLKIFAFVERDKQQYN